MATRHGHRVLKWLEKRGWKPAPVPEEFICGDQRIIDPETDKEMSVYEGAKLQKERTGEYPEFLKQSV